MIVNTNGKRALLTLGAVTLSASMAVGQAPRKGDVGEETLAPGQVLGVVGRHVQDADGADAGRLWDVLIDSNGEPRAVVIDYGGVLGVGRRKIAIAWNAVRFTPGASARPIRLMLTRQQMGAVPTFAYGSVPVTLGDGR
jgi:PRC-barrel domain protein